MSVGLYYEHVVVEEVPLCISGGKTDPMFCDSKSGAQPQSTKLLISIKPLLNDCRKTLDKLCLMLDGIDKPGMLRKPIKALKINLISEDIDLIRHQIRSYSSAMQMTLHMVGM